MCIFRCFSGRATMLLMTQGSMKTADFFLLAMMLSVPNVKIFWVENGIFKVYIWQPFEARIIKIWRPNSGTPGLHFNY